MKRIMVFIFIALFLFLPRLLAQTTDNADFNPFPQMEQDLNSVQDQPTSDQGQQYNEDQWPPSNAQSNEVHS